MTLTHRSHHHGRSSIAAGLIATAATIATIAIIAILPSNQAIAVPGPSGGEHATSNPARYETRADHSPDGIGKFYQGREIAHVMGHSGAAWLERPEREQEERPDLAIPALKLRTGDAVADIGAGTGYFSWRLALAVGATGRVYAVEIQQEMLDDLGKAMSSRGVTNVIPTLGTITAPGLPKDSIDLAIMVDVYHEFSEPFEMMQAICASLKPGGRVAFVEYRAEDPTVPIKPLHKMSEAQLRKEMAAHPLQYVETITSLPRQHVVIFRRVKSAGEPKRRP